MNGILSLFESLGSGLFSVIGALLGGIILLLIAWLIAFLFKKAVTKGLTAVKLDAKLVDWKFASTKADGQQTVNALGQVVYYLVWVLFLPGIFATFGLETIGQPIANMINTALDFLPNIIGAIVVVILGVFAAKFVRNLTYNFLVATNVDSYLNRFLNGGSDDSSQAEDSNLSLTKTLSTLVYILVLLPILLVAIETLNIQSIGQPIALLLTTILSAIPNIIVAAILLGVGFVAARFVSQILTDLLRGTGLNKYSEALNSKVNVNLDLAKLTGQVVAVIVGLLFVVEAISALNLTILNAVGAAIIAYIPSVLVAGILALVAFLLGEFLSSLISKATSSHLATSLVKGLVYGLAAFMILDQLNFATNIVNVAFFFLIGALAIAFALAFGLGGRDFARRQLEKADDQIDKESKDNNNLN